MRGGGKFEVYMCFCQFLFLLYKVDLHNFQKLFLKLFANNCFEIYADCIQFKFKHSKHKYVFSKKFERKQKKCFSNGDYCSTYQLPLYILPYEKLG